MEHEFLSELLRDESCPPNSSQAHPQTELVSTILSDASHAVGTDSIDEAMRVQLISEGRKLGGIPLMSVVKQQRGGPGANCIELDSQLLFHSHQAILPTLS